jgi:phage terminase small subunit
MFKSTGLTEKQERFCREYIIDLNAKQAAIRSEYSVKTAESQGSYLLSNPKVQDYVSVLLKSKDDKLIATSDEVLKLLTQFCRGEEVEECIIIEGQGDGISEARKVAKKIVPRDRLKAMELMAKYHKLMENGSNNDKDDIPKIIEDI